jgi:pseudouridine-5'-phosphate glycosidase
MLTPVLSNEVAEALAGHRPVVALETTIFSTLGLPRPHNRDALERCDGVIRSHGAVPALTAVLDGVPRVGIDPSEWDKVLEGEARKVAERDLAVAVAQRWPIGATTVSASLALADRAGISVFATGGIGGVHRGDHGDVSGDLDALAHHAVICVCAGAKAFLDLPRTLEHLEMIGVPVVGFETDHFPAFYTRSSGLSVPHRIDDPALIAAMFQQRARSSTGVLVAVPIPIEAEIPAADLDHAIVGALAKAAHLTGPALTPFILGALAGATEGRSVPANLALAEHNAGVAARIAVALAK